MSVRFSHFMVRNVTSTHCNDYSILKSVIKRLAHLIYSLVRSRNFKAAIFLGIFAQGVIHFDSVPINPKLTLLLLV